MGKELVHYYLDQPLIHLARLSYILKKRLREKRIYNCGVNYCEGGFVVVFDGELPDLDNLDRLVYECTGAHREAPPLQVEAEVVRPLLEGKSGVGGSGDQV